VPAAEQCEEVFLAVTEPYRRVSTDLPPVIHVADCEVVPQASYGIRTVNVDSGIESDELIVSTVPRPASGVFAWWADAVGALSGFCNGGDTTAAPCDPRDSGACGGNPAECKPAWPEPDGFTNFDDVSAALKVFNAFGPNPVAPIPAGVPANPDVPDITWVDMHDREPNSVSNAADVQFIGLAFQGRPYPFPDPVDCPDVGIWP